jgi:hypothetical protein
MTKLEFKNKYLQNAFFWVNEENHIRIQEIMKEFGFEIHTGHGFITWHKGFNCLCTFDSDVNQISPYYQKVNMWSPNARYGDPKNVDDFFKDYELLED